MLQNARVSLVSLSSLDLLSEQETDMKPMKFFLDTHDIASQTFPAGLTPEQFEQFYAGYEQACYEEEVVPLRVITSYSIHYTKLYEGLASIVLLMLISLLVGVTLLVNRCCKWGERQKKQVRINSDNVCYTQLLR